MKLAIVIKEVERCPQCPHFKEIHEGNNYFAICKETHKDICNNSTIAIKGIPDWCPLETVTPNPEA